MSVPSCQVLSMKMLSSARSEHRVDVLGRHNIYWTMSACPCFAQASMLFGDATTDDFTQGHRWGIQLR